ncbi:dihydroorotate dehydrogenase electron transfer subunit, partial [mine drainage metagenome]
MIHAEIIRKEKLSPTVSALYFHWNAKVLPGQFVMVWAPGTGEIPMSLSHLGREKAFTIKNYGQTSDRLINLEAGDRIFFRGPYGRPFSPVKEKALLIGGGSGMASLHPLIKRNAFGLIAARTRDELLFMDEFEPGKVIATTDDGSFGVKGNALAGLKQLDLETFDKIYACGPEIMLFSVYNYLKDKKVDAELSLERTMKCGVGVCDSCSINGFQLCVDGPTFTMDQLRYMNEFGSE